MGRGGAKVAPLGVGTRRFFSQVPHLILDFDEPLSSNAIHLYLRILRTAGHGGGCWKSQRTFAKEMMISQPTVGRAMDEIIKAGLIASEERVGPKGNYNHLTVIDVWDENNQKYMGGGDSFQGGGDSPMNQGGDSPMNHKNIEEEKNIQKKKSTPPNPLKGESARDNLNAMVGLWNVAFGGKVVADDWRIPGVNRAMKENPDLDWFGFFERIKDSDFLMGKNGGSWKITFDWVFCDRGAKKNRAKILEGNYDRPEKKRNDGWKEKFLNSERGKK